ncbi:MAG: TonB-dependent receptor [Blastocatellia bacterium]
MTDIRNAASAKLVFVLVVLIFLASMSTIANAQGTRLLSGVVVSSQFELVPNLVFEVETAEGKKTVATDAEGAFSVEVPNGTVTVRFFGKNIAPFERAFSSADKTNDLQLKISYVAPPVTASVTIEADALAPDIELRNEAIYKNSLFGRDDQLIFTLNAGINAGQHEGGGKSLEIRRFGFNTDHGGVNGGLKILVDNIQQNQGTQGHGQGYLGNLKSISPELVRDVSIINGPFSAAYGDFSGLGVVRIKLRESLPDRFTARVQGGSFNTFRGFFAYSPSMKNIDAFVAYEPSYTDGPFENPLNYRRDNISGNVTYKFSDTQAVGVKVIFGRNNFFSSGQIPLDEVAAGRLGRFDAIDPENGGSVRLATVGAYYRKEWKSGTTFKADAFVGRSLFDLFSNFTFFLADPIYGDEIQQHDSRLQEGGNLLFMQPYKFAGVQSLLAIGGGVHLNQIRVGLYPTISRNPNRKFLPENIDNPNVLLTDANAKVNNYSGYIQNTFALFDGHLRVDAGLRFDYFDFDVDGFEFGSLNLDNPSFDHCSSMSPRLCGDLLSGRESDVKFQPKIAVAWSPFDVMPISFYANYGRGISSQDARGVIRQPEAPKISTTDFYQAGTSYNSRRVSLVFSTFLLDRSNEQVYIPDDGSIELAGHSRSYGFEIRNSIRFNRFLSLNGGLTQVIDAYYPGEFTADGQRVIVDSAPKTVANGGLVFNELRGFNFSLNWRHINSYRLDAEDAAIKASGHDVVDFYLTKRLRKWIDLNFAVDNLFNKKYFETQNFFESRVLPGEDSQVGTRIHATPGYPFTVSAGITFRFGSKN